jgi:hypothetical protein
MGLLQDEFLGDGLMLRRDAAPKQRMITTLKPKAKTGSLMGPRIYPWGSIQEPTEIHDMTKKYQGERINV